MRAGLPVFLRGPQCVAQRLLHRFLKCGVDIRVDGPISGKVHTSKKEMFAELANLKKMIQAEAERLVKIFKFSGKQKNPISFGINFPPGKNLLLEINELLREGVEQFVTPNRLIGHFEGVRI